VLGPEHEFSIVDEYLHPLPVVDQLIKRLCGRIKNSVAMSGYALGKELQAHVAELKAEKPFTSPQIFEETMHRAVLEISEVVEGFGAMLLGLGMHPTLRLNEAKVWSHRDRSIYEAFDQIFGLKQHGWLNIQSFQLNLPYLNEDEAVRLYNTVASILPYLPAISASSPIYESKFGEYIDNRLHFYEINQENIPSITGDIKPEPIDSFEMYHDLTIRRYSKDLEAAGAPNYLLNKEWINSRGAILRFDRRALEIRIMDEQECIKSDVALSCFIRSLLRGLMWEEKNVSLHSLLVKDLQAVIRDGLNAKVSHPSSSTARGVCHHFYEVAYNNSSKEERSYLPVIKKRIEKGNLSDLITDRVRRKAQRTDLEEAIISVYLMLAEKLKRNEVFN
jgi:gamma-glutamyl:cysteine ligase YbdK (ATP-grasp superfamily)